MCTLSNHNSSDEDKLFRLAQQLSGKPSLIWRNDPLIDAILFRTTDRTLLPHFCSTTSDENQQNNLKAHHPNLEVHGSRQTHNHMRLQSDSKCRTTRTAPTTMS